MTGWAESGFLSLNVLNLAAGLLVFLACLVAGLISTKRLVPPLPEEAVPLEAPDERPISEWPRFSAAVPSPVEAHAFEVPGLGLTMADGGEPVGSSFSIRMPDEPQATGRPPNMTWNVRVGETVYYVATSDLPPSVQSLSPETALEALGASAMAALARSGPCRLVRSDMTFLQGRPCLTFLAESRPSGQSPYCLMTSIVHTGAGSLAVAHGSRKSRFREERFLGYAATLRLAEGPPADIRPSGGRLRQSESATDRSR